MGDLDLKRLAEAISDQRDVLAGVAEGKRDAAASEGDYRRLHSELTGLLSGVSEDCFCNWSSIWAWWAEALALGDPGWRHRLAELMGPNLSLLDGLPEQPRYQVRSFLSNEKQIPFSIGYARLADDQKVATKRAIEKQLAFLGPDITKDQRMGRWITKEGVPGARVLEFKVQRDASDLPAEAPDGTPRRSGYPKRKIEVRVFCAVSVDDTTIFLFNVYDKAGDVSDKRQDSEIDRAFVLLAQFRLREARARKDAARRSLA
ncbi:MAG: hypothetical protein QOE42_434 [Chloroflexota bacterium]|nr:hypothetical protein [Chloroflexota bacterium]